MIDQIINTRPDRANRGSCPPWKLRHLYNICKNINPDVIIESGSWKGNSLWLFRHAFPSARLISHDINFSNLLWRDITIQYREYDITKENYDINKESAFIFFDDHINQQKRLEWAKRNGFKYLVFDDNIPYKDLKNFKLPPSPTLEMLREKGKLPKWVKEYTVLDYDGSDPKSVNGGQTYLTYVRL